jgi:hypothetical protein
MEAADLRFRVSLPVAACSGYLDTVEVTGSIPVSPTTFLQFRPCVWSGDSSFRCSWAHGREQIGSRLLHGARDTTHSWVCGHREQLLPVRGLSVACMGCGHVRTRSLGEFGPSALQVGGESFAHRIGDVAVEAADAGHLVSLSLPKISSMQVKRHAGTR